MKNIDLSLIHDRKELRKALRQRRNQLSALQQHDASLALVDALLACTMPQQTVALYLANDGELSPDLAINQLRQHQRHCLLPVMHSFQSGYLNFQSFDQHTPMHKNRFGILEPKLNASETVPLEQIDVIFMPLVGFDSQGNRLGMGGGFYDRTLAHLKQLSTRPKLIGLAHDCQQVSTLPIASWDIAIEQIITPSKKITPAD